MCLPEARTQYSNVFASNHILAGAVIGAHSRRPGQAFVIGLASHLVMDAVPHWGIYSGPGREAHWYRVARRDGLSALALIALCTWRSKGARVAVLAGMFGAVAPDLDKVAVHFGIPWPAPQWWNRLHADIQHESPRQIGRASCRERV